MIAAIDIAWQRFGNLVAITPSGGINSNGDRLWRCLCDCGKYKLVSVHELRWGKTRSCGCAKRERMRKLGKEYVRRKRSKTDAKLIGICFGTRVVIGRSRSRPYYFLVRCQQCGEEQTMRSDQASPGVLMRVNLVFDARVSVY